MRLARFIIQNEITSTTQPLVVVDSYNYLDEQQPQWSPGMLFISSDGGCAGTEHSTKPLPNQSGQISKSTRSEKDTSLMLLETFSRYARGNDGGNERKRVMFVEQQRELDTTMRRKEWEFFLKMMSMITKNPVLLPVMPPPVVLPYSMHCYPYSHGFDGQVEI